MREELKDLYEAHEQKEQEYEVNVKQVQKWHVKEIERLNEGHRTEMAEKDESHRQQIERLEVLVKDLKREHLSEMQQWTDENEEREQFLTIDLEKTKLEHQKYISQLKKEMDTIRREKDQEAIDLTIKFEEQRAAYQKQVDAYSAAKLSQQTTLNSQSNKILMLERRL